MAKFVQIIEFKTSRIDDIKALGKEFRARVEGQPSALRRAVLTADRDRPGYYLQIVEFSDYESAMENSNRPETDAFASQMAALCDGPPKFYNLDVEETWHG